MEKLSRILLVQDNKELGQLLLSQLTKHGYIVDTAYEFVKAEKLFKDYSYQIVLLDFNLSNMDGLNLCRKLKDHQENIPIILISILADVQSKLDAFEVGIEDYLVKPYYVEELFARIKIFIKRLAKSEKVHYEENIMLDDLEIDFSNKTVNRYNESIFLTTKEFALLVLLSKNRGHVISKNEILEKVWGFSFDTGTNTVEVYISFLRKKLEKPFNKKIIFTKSGFGYFVK